MPRTRSKVLVVDDEETIREVLREGLDERGYDVEVAETAVGALAAARERRPDVVLLDLYMPGALTGDQAMKALSAFAPAIVVTASTDEELGRRLLTQGAFDFVMKPFDFARITELVEAAIAHGRGGR
ncbi:MAG: response regulator [Candidatus Rokubacteria bacterium]|nr:response regulator [Candidatus Rokubacteria bacterium]